MPEQNNPARRVAYTMIFIWMVGAGIAASFTISGETGTSLAICGGAFVLGLLIFFIGGFIVASSPASEE